MMLTSRGRGECADVCSNMRSILLCVIFLGVKQLYIFMPKSVSKRAFTESECGFGRNGDFNRNSWGVVICNGNSNVVNDKTHMHSLWSHLADEANGNHRYMLGHVISSCYEQVHIVILTFSASLGFQGALFSETSVSLWAQAMVVTKVIRKRDSNVDPSIGHSESDSPHIRFQTLF